MEESGRRWINKSYSQSITLKRRLEICADFMYKSLGAFAKGLYWRLTVKEEDMFQMVEVFPGSAEYDEAPYRQILMPGSTTFDTAPKTPKKDFDA